MVGRTKVNIDQFTLGSKKRQLLWHIKRRHPVSYFINRLQWYLYPNFSHAPSFPIHVDFEASTRCDMSCPMCFRRSIKKGDLSIGDMNFDLYERLIDECAENGLYSIRLSWRGEPTMNPNLIEMVRYAKNKGIKEVSMISNGLNLNPEYSRKLVKAGLDYVTISLDGINENYERIRKPATFKGVVHRITKLREIRDKHGNGYPRIKVNTIWSEVKDVKEEYLHIFEPITDHITFNPDYDYSEESIEHDPKFVCQYPWQRVSIHWTGKVPMCISDKPGNNIIGDLNKQTIKEVWLGEKMQEVRKKHLEGKRLAFTPCQKCHRPVTPQIGNIRN